MALPYSEAAEKSLIARLLLDPRQLPVLAGIVRPEHFYMKDMGRTYKAMLDLSERGRGIDAVTVAEESGTSIDLLDLPMAAHGDPTEYAAIIKAHARRRDAMALLDRAYRVAESGEGDIMVAMQDAMMKMSQGSDENDLIAPALAVEGYIDYLNERHAGNNLGLGWGIPGMDELVNPAGGTELIVLAARPSVGKTAMAENIVDNWAQQGRGPILFASLEMSINKLIDRAIARRTGIDSGLIVRGKLDENSFSQARMSAEERRDIGVWYINNGWLTTSGLRSAAAKLKMLNDGSLGAIVVDYLQLLKDKHGGDNEVNRVSHISHNLKAISQEFDVPVLAMAQLSRAAADVEPQLHHLRESGAIEQDADTVIMLNRRNIEDPTMGVHVRKQRQGSVGSFKLTFNLKRQTFEPWFPPIPEWGMPKEEAEWE